MGRLIWGQLNKTMTTCLGAEEGVNTPCSSSSMSEPSQLSIKTLLPRSIRLSAVAPLPSSRRSAVKTWPLPHSSFLTPTQDLSHGCFHDDANAETAGWDAQWDKANRYQGEGCIVSRTHSGPYRAYDGQITRFVTTKLAGRHMVSGVFVWPVTAQPESTVTSTLGINHIIYCRSDNIINN